jgi:hypothetical protein
MNHPNPTPRSSWPWRAMPPAGMARALPPAAAKRLRSLNHRFQPCSREASTMTIIGAPAHAGDGALVLTRARAGDRHIRRRGGNQAPNAVEVATSGAHPLTSFPCDTPGIAPGPRLGGGS